jgi:hypothetical protein
VGVDVDLAAADALWAAAVGSRAGTDR